MCIYIYIHVDTHKKVVALLKIVKKLKHYYSTKGNEAKTLYYILYIIFYIYIIIFYINIIYYISVTGVLCTITDHDIKLCYPCTNF